MIPGVRLDRKLDRLLNALVVAGNFELVLVTYERDAVALVHEANLGFDATVAIGHDIGFEHVVFHVLAAEEIHGALEEKVIETVRDDLGAIFFKHVPLNAGTEPSERRKVYLFTLKLHLEFDLFEVFGVADRGLDPTTGGRRHSLAGHLEGTCRNRGISGGGQLARFRIKASINLRLHPGSGWNELFPRKRFGDYFDAVALLIEPVDFEPLSLARSDRELSRNNLELRNFAESIFFIGALVGFIITILIAKAVETIARGEIHFPGPNDRRCESFHPAATLILDLCLGENLSLLIDNREGAFEERGVDFSIAVDR